MRKETPLETSANTAFPPYNKDTIGPPMMALIICGKTIC